MAKKRSLRILVTGGSGFIGTHVVSELIRRGHSVVSTTRRKNEKLLKNPNLSWLSWDATHDPLPRVDWRNLDIILHLASPAAVFDFPKNSVRTYEVVVAATFRLLEKASRNGVKRMLIASTGDVLGHNTRPASEKDLLYLPSSFYGAAKACSEILVRAYQSILSTAILRFYHPYGPLGDAFLVNRLVKFVSEGKEVRITGRNGIRINPVWVSDLARGVCLAIESTETGIFHFAGPETMTLRKLVKTIGDILKRKPIIKTEPGALIERHVGGFEITRRILGYDPEVSIQEGIRRLLDFQTKKR